MVKTLGLTHIALAVRDPELSFQFYAQLLGVIVMYRRDDLIQVQTPESNDILVFERNPHAAGPTGGIMHFGFRLEKASDIGTAVASIQQAGGTVLSTGEFCPGEPYVFFRDPDGYEVEIWYELPAADARMKVASPGGFEPPLPP